MLSNFQRASVEFISWFHWVTHRWVQCFHLSEIIPLQCSTDLSPWSELALKPCRVTQSTWSLLAGVASTRPLAQLG